MTQYEAYLAQCSKEVWTPAQPFHEWFTLDADNYANVIDDIKALDGRILATLTADENSQFDFFVEKGRKYGVTISVISLASREELMKATSKEQADQILMMKNRKISVAISLGFMMNFTNLLS